MIDRDSPVTEDELHAYVDGELPADRKAVVAAWLADHPEQAALVASWRAQAESIRAHFGATIDEPMPQRLKLDQIMKHERANGRSWMAMAAAAALWPLLSVAQPDGWRVGLLPPPRAALTCTPAKLSTLTSFMWSRYAIPSKCPAASACT